MPEFTTRHHVQHTAAQMFDLVADIKQYPAFLPLCEDLKIRRREVVDGKPVLIADMTVGYKAITETFTSRVQLDRARSSIRVSYIDGPFRYLDNVWTFQPAQPGANVDFHISYAFKSKLLEMLVGGLFDKAFRKFTAAFEARALEIYGQPNQGNSHTWLTDALRPSEPPVAT